MKILILILALIAVGVLIAFISTAFYTRKVHKKYPASGVSVKVDGSDVHVLTQGDSGPVILMLHGASANAREYEWTLAPLLSETHRVFMVDRPGHGHSDRPENAETLAVQAAQAAGALKALAPEESAVIVGHSFGGAVALRLALDHSELVSGLVLLAPVSHDWGSGGEAWYNSYAASSIIGPLFSQLVPIVGPAQVKQGVKGVFSPQPAPEGYFEKSAIGLLFRPSEFRANARDVNALRVELAAQQERYTDISAPTVVFSGAGDTVISPPLHVGKLKHQVEGLRLVALSDDGHMPHHAYGVDIAETIRNMSKTS